jgi:hypothetical protein
LTEQGAMMSEHNFVTKLVEFANAHPDRFQPGMVPRVDIHHEPWCGIVRGGRCNCDPVIEFTKCPSDCQRLTLGRHK